MISHFSEIRHKLNNAFNDPELTGFCFDHFLSVYDNFAQGMQKDQKITGLLDYCSRHPTRIQELLGALRTEISHKPYQAVLLKPVIRELEKYLAKEPLLAGRQHSRLYNAFLKLDYHEQVVLFRRLRRQRASAFLIHGPEMFGQRWLLNRLVANVLQDGGFKFTIRLQRRISRIGLNALWADMYRQLGLHSSSSASGVVDKIFELWKTQNVVLIFYEVDWMPEAYLQEFLNTFWESLKKKGFPHGSFKLFMFLIDYCGEVNHWNLPFDEPSTVTNKPYPIIKLPILTAFDESLLTNWAAYHDFLPVELIEANKALEIIHASENGTPELVMQHICEDILGCRWFNGVETCLAY